MKKGQIVKGTIERLEFPNKGVFYEEGKKVVVKNALPGQTVQCRIQKIRHGNAQGLLQEVIEKSELEMDEPACIHFGECGGCLYQGIPYEAQLDIKKTQVLDLLVPVVQAFQPQDVTGYFMGMVESPLRSGYRNKMEFSFGDAQIGGELMLGMHKRGSFHDIVPVLECQIMDSDFRAILRATLFFFREKGIPFYHKMRREGVLRHLLVRKGFQTGEILISLVTTTQNTKLLDMLQDYVKMLCALPLSGTIAGILHTENDSLADAVINEKTTVLHGKDYFNEELLGLTFKITPFSFFQTNSRGAEKLYETARDYIGGLSSGKESVVYDLYSGTGTIAQMLSPVAKKVIGVEIVEEAVLAARENAALNGISNCEFIAGDVLKVLDTIEEKPDLIVLDPPREGIHPRAIGKIIAYGVQHMLYISCKPTSLQRDLQILLEAGYRVERMCCVDMFPGTANIETVCLLNRIK